MSNAPKNGEQALKEFMSQGEGFEKPKKKEKPKEVDPDSMEVSEDLLAEVDNKEDSNKEKKGPMSYSERLEKLEISDEDAMELIDEICEKGSYLKDYIVRKARKDKAEVKVVFSTRDTRTQGFITKKTAKEHENIPMIYNKIMGELQLAASIVYYNGKQYDQLVDIEDDEEFEAELIRRVREFSKLPAPITVVLTNKLSEFDLRVAAVMAPGYEDFF